MINTASSAGLQDPSKTAFHHEATALIVLLLLLGGLGLTIMFYGLFEKLDQQRLEERVASGGNTLKVYGENTVMGEMFLPIMDKMQTLQQRFSGKGVVVSEAALKDELWDEPLPGMGEIHFEYLPRISAERRVTLDETLEQSENAGFPFVERRDGQIRPVEERPVYYPVLLEASISGKQHAIIGMDRGADDIMRFAMEQATLTGAASSYTHYSLGTPSSRYTVTWYFVPLYGGDSFPVTPDQRSEQHVGYISLVSYLPNEETLPLLPEDLPGIKYAAVRDSGEAFVPVMADSLQAALDNATAVQAKYRVPSGEDMVLIAQASPALVQSMASPEKVWVLGGGVLLTFSLCYLVLWSRQQALRVMQLVKERTRELALQTELLSESNSALMASESRYRMLADNVTDIIYTYDLDGQVTYVSPSIKLQTGFDVNEFLGYPVYHRLSVDSAQRAKLLLARMDRSPQPDENTSQQYRTFGFEIRCSDGLVRSFETTVSALRAQDGRVEGFLGVARGMSERFRSRREKVELEKAELKS